MQTSKPFALLFCKENCHPCAATKAYRDAILTEAPQLGEFLSTLTVTADSQWRQTYSLNKFPTLIVVDDKGAEIERVVGGKNIRHILRGVLVAIRRERSK